MSHAPTPRVGVFGGAFDPPHRAHLALAQAAVEQLRLDALHIVPTGTAWHKQRSLSAAPHRLAMCALAFGGLPRVWVDDCELQRSGPSFTIDTLRTLQTRYGSVQLYLVLGADQARALPTWHRIEDIVAAATICVAVRDGDGGEGGAAPAADSPALSVPFQWLHLPASALSATEIRQRVVQGRDIAPLVTDPVARYIEQHHLYQAA